MKNTIFIFSILVSLVVAEKSFSATTSNDKSSEAEKVETVTDTSAKTGNENAVPVVKRLGKPHATFEINGESSSFIGDPDPLDPLPVNRENLKDDDEPILEDIRQVLDVKPKKDKIVKVSKKRKSKKKKGSEKLDDAAIEKRFHDIYEKYNSNPTSVEAWSKATDDRKSDEYTVQKGDTLWTISKTLFGNSEYWPKIWALNRQGISNPHFISPGLKIHFYPGSEEVEPTLDVGEKFVVAEQSSATTSNIIRKKVPGSGPSVSAILDDESEEDYVEIDLGPVAQEIEPAIIPDSIPIFRNEFYFKAPLKAKIDLLAPLEVNNNFTNDIILSDLPLVSEVKISLDSISTQRCSDEQIINGIKYVRAQDKLYSILERVDKLEVDGGKLLYAYKVIGEAKPYRDGSIIITECNSILTTDLYLVKKSNLPLLKTKRQTYTPNASLIGGPNLNKQSLFAFHQYAYVHLGNLPVESGQFLSIKSQQTDRINGEVKIVEKFGSYAIAVITEINDKIERGDSLQIKK